MYTYKCRASNVLTENNGDVGSFLCTSMSFLHSIRPFLTTFCSKDFSAFVKTTDSSELKPSSLSFSEVNGFSTALSFLPSSRFIFNPST